MTHILSRAALAGAITLALAQAAPAQVLLRNTSFEDSPFFITPWELVNDSNLVNPRLVKDARYGNYFSATLRWHLSGEAGVRQAFSIGGTSATRCAFSAYWRTVVDGPSTSPFLVFEVLKRSDSTSVVGRAFSLNGSSQDRLWQPIGYQAVLPPGDYWASIAVRGNTRPVAFDLDELVLRYATLPIVSPAGRDGPICAFNVVNSDDRVWHVLSVALQRLENPLAIPGIKGALELDPFRDGGLIILGVKLGSSTWALPYGPIASLDRTIFLQALDFNPILNVMQFGSRTGVLYYK